MAVTSESSVVKNIFYDLATDSKQRKYLLVKIRKHSSEDWSEPFYPWFLIGGYGKIASHKAMATKLPSESTTNPNGLKAGPIIKFSEIDEFQFDDDFKFQPIGCTVEYTFKKSTSYPVLIMDTLFGLPTDLH